MSFLASSMFSNILSLISVVLSITAFLQESKKVKMSKTCSQVKTIYVQEYISSCRQTLFLSQSAGIELDWLLFAIFIIFLGNVFQPFSHILCLIFPVFWWFVLICIFRFSNKKLALPDGCNPIVFILGEAIVVFVLLLAIEALPYKSLFESRILGTIEEYFLLGLPTTAYFCLCFLGLQLIVFSFSKESSRLSKQSVRLLYKFYRIPLLFIGMAFFFICLLIYSLHK